MTQSSGGTLVIAIVGGLLFSQMLTLDTTPMNHAMIEPSGAVLDATKAEVGRFLLGERRGEGSTLIGGPR